MLKLALAVAVFMAATATTSVNAQFCPLEDAAVQSKLRDKGFMDATVACLLDKGPCKSSIARDIKSKSILLAKGMQFQIPYYCSGRAHVKVASCKKKNDFSSKL